MTEYSTIGPISMEAEVRQRRSAVLLQVLAISGGTLDFSFIPEQDQTHGPCSEKVRSLDTGKCPDCILYFLKGGRDLECSTFNRVMQRSSKQNYC